MDDLRKVNGDGRPEPKTRRWIIRGLCCALWAGAFCAAGEPAAQEHRFFKCGWNSGGPGIYSEQFQQEWALVNSDELSDGWALPDGGVAFSFSNRKQKTAGVIRLDADKQPLWTYTAPDGSDNHSCQPLPHGGFLLGECGKDALWMVEIDADGRELKRVKVTDAPVDIHHAFRAVRKTAAGTYLATLMKGAQLDGKPLAGGRAYEWDSEGNLIHTFPSGSFHAVRLSNGNTMVSNGHGAGDVLMAEYTPDNSEVWTLTGQDLKEVGLCVSMVCGFHRLPNGNTVISNVKHGKKTLGLEGGETPKAFEMTPDKQVVWMVPASTSPKNMGSFQVLDVPGDPCRFEILR